MSDGPMSDLAPILVPALTFAAVGTIVFLLAQHSAHVARLQRRLPVPIEPGRVGERPTVGFAGFLTRHVDEKRFGLDGAARDRLRRELLKAGFFSPAAVTYYVFARVFGVVALPLAAYLATAFVPDMRPLARVSLTALAALAAMLGPDTYLARRRRALARQYRLVFPDMLDLLVVCVDAGLTLDAAFDRIRPEIGKQSRALASNLDLMGAEMRAGRSMMEALESLADRLNLDEARSFVTLLRQSMALGSDIGESLRVFSDDMRDKRLLRAEETANKLSVKIVLPLGLFIFPVVLLVIMLPVIVRLLAVMARG
jgi:tight adherence protein C